MSPDTRTADILAVLSRPRSWQQSRVIMTSLGYQKPLLVMRLRKREDNESVFLTCSDCLCNADIVS